MLKAPNRQTTHQITGFKGQNSAGNRDGLTPGEGKLIYNFFIEHGIIKKVPGSTVYINSGIATDPVLFVKMFLYRWMYQIGTNLIIESAEGSQVETLIDSTFDKARIFADIWQGSVYLANGIQLRYFNGTSINELGILPPGLGLTPRASGTGSQLFLGDGGSGALPAGSYDYTFTFFDPVTQSESLPIGSLVTGDGLFNTAIFDSAANPTGWIYYTIILSANRQISVEFTDQFVLAAFQNAPARATQINMYRRDPGSGTFALSHTFNIDRSAYGMGLLGGSYIDNTLVGSLGVLLIPDQQQPPPTTIGPTNGGAGASVGPKYIRFWRDSLWAFGASFPAYTVTDATENVSQLIPAADSILYASDTDLPDYWPFNYNAGAGDGQRPTGVAVSYDTLLAFKERSIYVILGSDITNFVLKILDPIRGCIAPGSLQETPIGVVFLSEDGLSVCNGTGPAQLLSMKIDDEIKNINFTNTASICSTYDRYKSVYKVCFPTGTGTDNTRYIELNVTYGTLAVGNIYNPTALAFGVGSKSNSQIKVGNRGGKLLDASSRSVASDNGQTIYAIFRSDEIDFGVRGKFKRLFWVYITAAAASDWLIDIKIYADYAQGPIYEQDNIDASMVNSEYAASDNDVNGAVYDTGNNQNRYGGPQTFQRIKIPVQGVGRTFYLEIQEHQNNSNNVLFDIHSIEVEGEVMGK